MTSLGVKCTSSGLCYCDADADCASNVNGHKCDQGACSCATDPDCPTGKKCTGTYDGISICE